MLAFYERRTNGHIERVRKCLTLLAAIVDCGDELAERARSHDASKFGPEEYIPYVWLTEYHRRRRAGERFEYPEGIADQVKSAIEHHFKTNRHHPEFHANPNDMSDVDLIEMVCDWTAMAQEFGEQGGSARNWADKTIGKRVAFNADKSLLIYQMIDQLDKQIAAQSDRAHSDRLPEQVCREDVPGWHLTELAKRRARAESEPAIGKPWREVLARLEQNQ
ncbi:hypothetical protein BH10PLA2_BH10PLA2_25990 [soil metagenome]